MLSRVSIDIFSFLLTAFIVKSPKSSSNTPDNTSSRVSLVLARGGHSNKLCTNTRDRGQERGQAVKTENLEGKAVKGIFQIRKVKGQAS